MFTFSHRILRVWVLSFFAMWMTMASSAYAQVVRTDNVTNLGHGWARSWVDVNGDGRDDYCSLAGENAERLECLLSDGVGFTTRMTVNNLGPNTDPSNFRWVDVNGDGQIDLCRIYVDVSTYPVSCYLGPNFTTSVSTSVPKAAYNWDLGLSSTGKLFFGDVNGDGRADLCYISDSEKFRCLLANGSGFDGPSSAWTKSNFAQVDPGWSQSFVDFNGDGFADFCRVLNDGTLICLLGGPNGFAAAEPRSASLARPHSEVATFIDINGDGKTDFCRILGEGWGNNWLSCAISNGVKWEATERTSPVLNLGDHTVMYWVDINADGLPDFCRVTSPGTLACRLARGDGDGVTPYAFNSFDVTVSNVDFGLQDSGRTFCDAAGTGIQTLCRVTHQTTQTGTSCTEREGQDTYCYPVYTDTYGLMAGLTGTSLQARQGVMTAFTDGTGAETRITYLPMSSTEVYSRSGIGGYPRAIISLPRSPVVYETRAWRQGTSETLTGVARYFYKDLRSDNWAGSRGFRERWILTEGSNTLEHVVYFQGLGPSVDTGSQLNDSREIGLVKYSERYAVANSLLPAIANTSTMSPRQARLKQIQTAASSLSVVPTGAPTAQSPFILLQATTNSLADTSPANPRLRFIGSSTVKSGDWNGTSLLAMPQVDTTTQMTDLGNVTSIVQTTTAPNGLVWRKTTTNAYADNVSTWTLGRLTQASVTSESPTADAQIAADNRSKGWASGAGNASYVPPASTPTPLSPALMMLILGDD